MSQYILSTHGLTKTTTITITQWWQHFGAGSGGKSSVAGDENENSVMNSFRIEVIWLPLWCSSVHWQKKNTRSVDETELLQGLRYLHALGVSLLVGRYIYIYYPRCLLTSYRYLVVCLERQINMSQPVLGIWKCRAAKNTFKTKITAHEQ